MQAPSHADRVARSGASPVPRWLTAGLCGIILLGWGQLQAQTVYRSVGPDGQVTFSDMPGGASANNVTPVDSTAAAAPLAAAPSGAALPFELRQVVGKYPVTLYTSSNCAPCDSGRKLLLGRGVPFSEKTISSAQDAEAFQRLSGSNSVPFMTLGAQQVAGFSASEWNDYLTAAGYPERSRLPANYLPPQAAPLAPQKKSDMATRAPDVPAAPVAPAATDRKISPNNPTGIQF
ncbi:MAG: glutaredoxin family protein [Rhodoferax sp.]|nr:glutaredoxin family protein [Rhodoferax sp.]